MGQAGDKTGGCGNATSDVGPFYCPTDQTIYLDTDFYQQVLEGQLGGKDAPFLRAYVIAHEFGHHIQKLLGYMGQVRTQRGPKSDSVKLELQADCYAGMWAQAAQSTPAACPVSAARSLPVLTSHRRTARSGSLRDGNW